MAETFRARLTGAAGVTKSVVIKKVLPSFAEDEAFVTAFINEARVSASLSHGNIAQVFDFGEVDGDYFLAMELIDGCSLAELLARAAEVGFARLPVPIACFLAVEVLKGLHYAHTRAGDDGQPLGIVHRDVSPDNVLVGFEGQVKVVDFGVAKAAMKGRAETEPGMVKGKYQYFSPEQAFAEPLDGRSDVFAVGVVLYRMLCGVNPFVGQMHVVMRAIADGRFEPAAVVNPALPSALASVLARAMATEKEARYPSALAMQEALSSFLYRQDPTFSSETVKEWVGWLFRERLEAEGRKVKPSARFERQLAGWREASETTTAGVKAIERRAAATRDEAAVGPGGGRARLPRWAWAVAAASLLLVGVAVGGLTGEPAAPVGPVAPPARPIVPRPPVVDQFDFPGAALVRGDRHRIHFEGVTLPGGPIGVQPASFREGSPSANHSSLFLVLRSNTAADGEVRVLTGPPIPAGAVTSFRVFDFQPFGVPLPGAVRTVLFSEGKTGPLTFTDSAAQIDARSAKWVTVRNPGAQKALLKLQPAEAGAGTRRTEASVLVAWEPRSPGGQDRAVLVEGAPLVVEGARTFALVFADSYASTVADSVWVQLEPTSLAPTSFAPRQPPGSPGAAAPSREAEAESYNEEARQLMKEKRYEAAREKLERCIKLAPKSPDCHKTLGTVWAQLGDSRRGAEEYRRFLDLAGPDHPSYPKVKEILESYEQAR